ncbi:MAG: PAS domain-containing protein, partial [Anaerolineae bacterium]|nr:PAS domain-containing protein [Anaerolineae bacterium]
MLNTLLTIINRNADGILVVDEDGVIRFVNPAAAALFGQPPGALVGEFFGFPMIDVETAEIDLLRRSTGELIAVEMRVVEIEWVDGVAYLASLRDISERRQAQADIALRNRIIDSSGSGIFITGVHGEARPIIYANPAMATFTGFSVTDLLAQDCRFLWHCNPDDAQNQALDRALLEGASCEAAIECERANGEMYWAEVHLTPIRDGGGGQLTHFIGVLHDITDRMYLDAERIERERIGVALEKERELRALKDRFLT